MKKRIQNLNGYQPETRWTCLLPQPRTLRRLGLVVGLLLFSGNLALAQVKLDAAPEYFYWQEEANGAKLLDESGFRIGVELSSKDPVDRGWFSAYRGKLYYGSVDYDGQLQNGTPMKTTTDYYGGLLEGRFGYRWGLSKKHFIDATGGVGIDFWLRQLGSQYGYDEYWFPIYLKGGVEVNPKEKGWIGALGLKVPVYNTEVVDLGQQGGGTVTLHPGVNVSGYAEAGYKFTRHLSLVAFFDSYWFGQSPTELGVYQPESKSYQVGAKLGWTF